MVERAFIAGKEDRPGPALHKANTSPISFGRKTGRGYQGRNQKHAFDYDRKAADPLRGKNAGKQRGRPKQLTLTAPRV